MWANECMVLVIEHGCLRCGCRYVLDRNGATMRGATSARVRSTAHKMYSSLFNPNIHTHHHFFDTTMLPGPLLTLITLLLLPLTLAQFGNFFQGGFPFGGGHFQGNQQDAPKSPGRQHKGWTEMESGEWGGPRHAHDAGLGFSWGRSRSRRSLKEVFLTRLRWGFRRTTTTSRDTTSRDIERWCREMVGWRWTPLA